MQQVSNVFPLLQTPICLSDATRFLDNADERKLSLLKKKKLKTIVYYSTFVVLARAPSHLPFPISHLPPYRSGLLINTAPAVVVASLFFLGGECDNFVEHFIKHLKCFATRRCVCYFFPSFSVIYLMFCCYGNAFENRRERRTGCICVTLAAISQIYARRMLINVYINFKATCQGNKHHFSKQAGEHWGRVPGTGLKL